MLLMPMGESWNPAQPEKPLMKLQEQTSFRQASSRNPVFKDSLDPGLRIAGVTEAQAL